MKIDLATFRRKIVFSGQLRRSRDLFRRCAGGAFGPSLPQERSRPRAHVRAASTLPILISVSAITPNPTHRFIPSEPR